MAENNAPNGPFALQNNAISAQAFRQVLASLVPASGVIGPGDLQVTANATPNMSVNVAAGFASIVGSQLSLTQGSYHCYNDAAVNKTIAPADATNARNDLVVASVQDAIYSGTNNQWVIQVITGTPSATPVDPTVPANSIKLARVVVAANTTSITSGAITDLRPRAGLLNTARGIYKGSVYVATAGQGVPTSGFNTVSYDTKLSDPNNNFTVAASPGQAFYTAPIAGEYDVRASVLMAGGAAGFYYVALFVNGTERKRIVNTNTSVGGVFNGSARLTLAVGDVVTVQMQAQQAGNTIGIGTSGQLVNYFDVMYLGN